MAIRPLDQRLDKLNEAVADTEQRDALTATKTEITESVLPQADLFMSDDVGAEAEGVVVAGGKTDFVRGLIKDIKGQVAEVEPRREQDRLLTPEAQQAADLEEMQRSGVNVEVGTRQELGIAGRVEQTKVEGMTPDALAAEAAKVKATAGALEAKPSGIVKEGEVVRKVAKGPFNLPLMSGDDDVRAFIQAIDNLDPAKPKKITQEQIQLKAQETGIGVEFIDDLFTGKLQVNPENTYKALSAVSWSGKRITELAGKVAEGGTPEEIAEMIQTIHFSHLLQQQVKGYQTNVAQSLAVMRMPRDTPVNMDEILMFAGSKADAQKFAQAFLDSRLTPKGKADLINGLAEGNVWQKLFGVYVNNILSRPGTHVRNFLSSALFIPYRAVERATAASIGSARQLIGMGTKDRYMVAELQAMLSSTPVAIRNGLDLAGEAFKTGVPKSWTNPDKIAHVQARYELFNHKNDGSLLSTAIKGTNYVTTLAGRSLLTADEFFKGINYTHDLAAESTRLGILKYEEAIAAGRSLDEAEAVARDAVDKYLSNPPSELIDMSEVGTFTQKLTGNLGAFQSMVNPNNAGQFLIRTQIPFIGTPINVLSESIARTPLAAFSPNLLRDLAKGGTKESDMALAKIGLGTSAIYSFMSYANDGNITGAGPGDRGTRETMTRQGWQPYSIVLDVGDKTSFIANKFPGMARFGTGEYEGKVFISYQGLEPVGALLAIGADISDYARYQDDPDAILTYVAGGVFGISNYMLEHPFLQGVNDTSNLLKKIFSKDPDDAGTKVDAVAAYIASTAQKAVTPIGGFITSVREQVDPMRRDYAIGSGYSQNTRLLMNELGRMRNMVPGLSSDLEPVLNIWSEPQSYEYAWAPLRMKEGQMREIDAHLLQLDVNQGKPPKSLQAVDPKTGISAKIRLSPAEANRMLVIANKDLKLQDRVLSITRPYMKNPKKANVLEAQKLIKAEFQKTFSDARKILLAENPELQQRLNDEAIRIQNLVQGAPQ